MNLSTKYGRWRVVAAVALDRRRRSEQLAAERVAVEKPRELLERRACPRASTRRLSQTRPTLVSPSFSGNEPDPVAPAGEVIGREAPRREDRALPRVGGVGAGEVDAVHVLDAVVADPDRGDRMRLDRRDAAALAREHGLPAGRVHEPAARDVGGRPVGPLDRQRVRPRAFAERPGGDLRRPPDFAALLARDREQVLVELRAVELEGRRAGELRGPGLGGLAQARDVVVDEPVAEGLLRKLLARQVGPLLEDPRQEVRRDLDGGLADLPVERARSSRRRGSAASGCRASGGSRWRRPRPRRRR